MEPTTDERRHTINLTLTSWGLVLETLHEKQKVLIEMQNSTPFVGSPTYELRKTIVGLLGEAGQSIFDQLTHQGCRHFSVVKRDGDPGDEMEQTR